MTRFGALFAKDLKLELRRRETVLVLLSLSIMLSVLASLGIQNAFVGPETILRIFPSFLWMVFIFSATISISRSYEYETEHDALSGIILSGTPPSLIFFSKALSNFIVMSIGLFMSLVALCAGLDIAPNVPSILVVSLGVVFGYSCLATLFGAMTASSKLKSLLLPLILIPLLFPLFFAANELVLGIVLEGRIQADSIWLSLLLTLDLVYLVLGGTLFEYVVKE